MKCGFTNTVLDALTGSTTSTPFPVSQSEAAAVALASWQSRKRCLLALNMLELCVPVDWCDDAGPPDITQQHNNTHTQNAQ